MIEETIRDWTTRLLATNPIQVGEWQSMTTGDSKPHATHELLNVTLRAPVPEDIDRWQRQTTPDLPWAEDHFLERVSGIPHNPPPSHVNWPYGYTDRHQDAGGQFDHTYPERFWPRWAKKEGRRVDLGPRADGMEGIRFRYGDLADVVNLLIERPLTRQAYLPVWFPEDTGAHAGQRVPCTLGYHFIIRNSRLHCTYYIRSCDVYRHLRNDIYLAGRLMQWICDQLIERWESIDHSQAPGSPYPRGAYPLYPGTLTMHITSLHMIVGDVRRFSRDGKTNAR